MNLKYLLAETVDIELLFELNKSLIDQYEDPSLIDLDKVLPWVRRKLTNKLPEYRSVFLNDQKVGYFRLYEADDDSLELDDLYILVPYQGRGIGSAVIRHCIAESERLGKPITLYVFSRNTDAVRLYEKMGFVHKETVSPTRSILIRPLNT